MKPYQPFDYLEDEIRDLEKMLMKYSYETNPGIVMRILMQLAEKRKLLKQCRLQT